MSQSAAIAVAISIQQSSSGDINSALNTISQDLTTSLLNGVAANQASQAFSDERTLAASTAEELDLAGTLSDVFGSSITFTKIKAIAVFADAGNGDNIEVGGSASNGFNSWVGASGDKINVPPGGMFLLTAPDLAGFAVTGGTGDLLTINNADSGASGTYKIVLIGTE